jgi:hypothetical protein
MLPRLLAAMCVAAMLATPAQAGLRKFPTGTKRGEITFTAPPQVQLNGQIERISPGTRIYNSNNRLVFASALRDQTFVVNYVRGAHRTLREIWLLTPDEAQEKLPPAPEDLNPLQQLQNAAPPGQLN